MLRALATMFSVCQRKTTVLNSGPGTGIMYVSDFLRVNYKFKRAISLTLKSVSTCQVVTQDLRGFTLWPEAGLEGWVG